MSRKYLLVIFFLSLVLFVRLFYFYAQIEGYTDGQKIEFETRISDEPKIKFSKQQIGITRDNGENITIITGLEPILQYGDRIKVSGTVSQKSFHGRKFNSLNNPSLQILTNDQNFITRTATNIRRFAKSFYRENLPPVSASLLTGIVFGGNQGLPDKFMQNLRSSGVVHVIAASGMNVTFVASALIAVLGAFLRRQIALTIAICGIIFYAFLAGFEPSIVRASIMAVIAFSARFLGRQNLAFISLFITGCIMLLISPHLLSDVGFQLSFLATLGILVIKPFFPKNGNILLDDLGTTIAAQVATVPILLSIFGNYGLLSILVNGLVLWTVPVLMILGSMALVFSFVFAPLGKIFLFLSLPILLFFENTIRYFGNLGWNLTITEISGFVWIGYYLLLFSVIVLIYQNRSKNKLKGENTP